MTDGLDSTFSSFLTRLFSFSLSLPLGLRVFGPVFMEDVESVLNLTPTIKHLFLNENVKTSKKKKAPFFPIQALLLFS